MRQSSQNETSAASASTPPIERHSLRFASFRYKNRAAPTFSSRNRRQARTLQQTVVSFAKLSE
jgi:hypothetical protein